MQQATHIYRNGTILTMDSRCSIVSCLAVSGETILAVGSEAEVAPFQARKPASSISAGGS